MGPLSTMLLCLPAALAFIVCACGLAVLGVHRRPRRPRPSSRVMRTRR
jgi:hypothetical protein